MQENATSPVGCPICGSSNLQTNNRQPVGYGENSRLEIHGALSYRCENAHVFLTATHAKD